MIFTACTSGDGLEEAEKNSGNQTELPGGNSDNNNQGNQGDDNQDDNQGDSQEKKPIFETDNDGNVTIDAKGGEVMVVISTNLDYTINIPEEALSWISVADTRTIRIDKLIFVIAENRSENDRSAIISLFDKEYLKLYEINLRQNGVQKKETSTPLDDIICNTNEIVYSTKYGYAIDLNTKNGFGGKFKGNNYRDGVGRISFDGDVTQIPESAFAECETLTYIKLPNSVVQIGESAFCACQNLQGIVLGDGVKKIFYYAFEDCTSLTNITISDGVSWIGTSAFHNCTKLKRVDVSSLSKWCTITFEDNPLSNGADLYVNNEKAVAITIPSDVSVVGENKFCNCTSITSVNIPDHVVRIDEKAFYGCDLLSEVIIGSGVHTIGSRAFMFCQSLSNVYCKPVTPPSGNFDMFSTYVGNSYVPLDCTIHVPTMSVTAYKRAFGWTEYADKIVGYDF